MSERTQRLLKGARKERDLKKENKTPKLKDFRQASGFTQEELALLLDIKRRRLQRLEHGECSPTAKECEAFAKAFGCPSEEIFPEKTERMTMAPQEAVAPVA